MTTCITIVTGRFDELRVLLMRRRRIEPFDSKRGAARDPDDDDEALAAIASGGMEDPPVPSSR